VPLTSVFFSERETGQRARVEQEIDDRVWAGLVALINARIADEAPAHTTFSNVAKVWSG
jgi:hypothetical protein